MSKLNTVPLALPPDIQREVKRGAKHTGLSQADVMRHGLRIGVPQFIERFPKPPVRVRRNQGEDNQRQQKEDSMH